MDIIPVIDVARGDVVRAIRGDRANYKPIKTPLAKTSHRPEAVKRGRAANRALGWREAQAQHSQLAQPPVDDVSGDMKNGQF